MGKNITITVSGLAPFTGEWTKAQAAHLLRRTTFGLRRTAILAATAAGLETAVEELLTPQAAPYPPTYYDYDGNPNIPVGETWAGKPYMNVGEERGPRNRSLRSWVFDQMIADDTITEKMTLFWINHFGVTYNGDPQIRYEFNALLREFATGNFRELVKRVTVHPAMLTFLNGNQNNRNSPNENYGRELLELFTIGKGPQIGAGDYSNYTEDDVRELARALTGWVNRGIYSDSVDDPPRSEFIPNRHDETDKQLSYHFDEQIIQNGGELEYQQVVDIILEKVEVARYICRKLYRFFVYYDITEQEEAEVIEPMAQLFFESNYDVKAVLTNLFSSQHFYDFLNQGPMIKTPVDFVTGIVRQFGYDHVEDAEVARNTLNLRIMSRITEIGMDYFGPPSVAGWEAWYQAPVFSRSWISSTSLQSRTRTTNQFTANGFNVGGTRFRFQYVEWIAELENPLDPNALVAEVAELFLPQPLAQDQLDLLKDILIPGLPDFEWTDEYGHYLTNSEDEALYNAIESKLEDFFRAIFGLAEFHLS